MPGIQWFPLAEHKETSGDSSPVAVTRNSHENEKEFVIGVYPMLSDETCWFLAVDFDKATWKEDAGVYLETCAEFGVPAALERSRSGNGGHIWIFFAEPIPAKLARQLGSFMLTQAIFHRKERTAAGTE